MTTLDAAVQASLDRLAQTRFAQRLWDRDPGVWKRAPEHQQIISNSLGWLASPAMMLDHVTGLVDFASQVRAHRYSHVVVLGMGGSSLCPDVCRLTFGSAEGYPELHILDSTVPSCVASLEKEIDIASTLFVVSSKSGSTIEPLSFQKYFFDLVRRQKGLAAGESFVAIADPGTILEKQAKQQGFRRVFPGQPDIGGRFSALSNFGMVPAALAGVEISTLLSRAVEMARACSPGVPVRENPGIVLGTYLAEAARAGRNKITFVMSAGCYSFGDWVEQLIAESTGKEGKGLVPVVREYIGTPEDYTSDRVFVRIALVEEKKQLVEVRLAALESAGHPVIRIDLQDDYDLGREFFRWEVATATIGALLDINPFDQPNVQESKDVTARILAEHKASGRLPEQPPSAEWDGVRIYSSQLPAPTDDAQRRCVDCVESFLVHAQSGGYFAFLPYLEPKSAHKASIQALRLHMRDQMRLATSVGYGPRYLHSTGQLHKGGDPGGLFAIITADSAEDRPVPGESFTFSTLSQAQALGDYEALRARGRPVIRFHLGAGIPGGLDHVTTLFKSAVERIKGRRA